MDIIEIPDFPRKVDILEVRFWPVKVASVPVLAMLVMSTFGGEDQFEYEKIHYRKHHGTFIFKVLFIRMDRSRPAT